MATTITDRGVVITSPKEIVLNFINALNEEHFNVARIYLADDMTFEGVMGSRNGADVYITDMEKMKFKYDIKKAFRSGNHVCLLYNINMSGNTIFTCGWYYVRDNKIATLKVVFDPRPLLEAKK